MRKIYTTLVLTGITIVVIITLNALSVQSKILSGLHLFLAGTGSLTIEAEKITQSCREKSQEWRKCYMDRFGKTAKSNNISYLLSLLDTAQNYDKKLFDCHMIAHAISQVKVAQRPDNWQELISQTGARVCNGGFIHGAIEALSGYDQSFVLTQNTLTDICYIIKDRLKEAGSEHYCSHIMGHLLLVETGGDIEKATGVCDKVPRLIQRECYAGTFMENITRDNLVDHGLAEKIAINTATTASQENLCRKYKGLAATACWKEMSHMYTVLSGDIHKIYKYCSRAGTTQDIEECYLHSTGLIIKNNNLSKDDLAYICSRYDNAKDIDNCSAFMIRSLLNASLKYKERAETFCSLLIKTGQPQCYEVIEQRLKSPSAHETKDGKSTDI